MSTATLPTGPMAGSMPIPATTPMAPEPVVLTPVVRPNVMIAGDEVFIPDWVRDLASFRRWSLSPEFPERGRIEYFDNTIWVDMTMEDVFSHVRIKFALDRMFSQLEDLGEFYPDGTRVVHSESGLSCEPDGTFVTWNSQRSMKVRYIETEPGRVMELEGTPDIVIEVLSDSSVKKDIELGPKRFSLACVPEYWLIDVRNGAMRFDINVLVKSEYQASPIDDGWQRSGILNKQIRLDVSTNPLGRPQYRLETR